MKIKTSQSRLAQLGDLTPGTVITPGSADWSGAFNLAIVIESGSASFEGKALFLLDGEWKFRIAKSKDEAIFIVVPAEEFWVDGIDNLQSYTPNDRGVLLLTEDGPLVRTAFHESERSRGQTTYVNLKEWKAVDFDSATPHETYASWRLISTDIDGKNERILLDQKSAQP